MPINQPNPVANRNDLVAQVPAVARDAIAAKSGDAWDLLVRNQLPDGNGGVIQHGARQAALLKDGWRRLCVDPHCRDTMIKNRLWRLSNLYYFRHIEDGSDILIDWNEPYLRDVYDAIWGGHESMKLVVLKTRQVFMTTAICCMLLDLCRFTKNQQCGISNYNDDDVKDTMRDKIQYAHEHSPILQWDNIACIQNRIDFMRTGSKIEVEQTARGRTMSFQLLTEFAKTCLFQKGKAEEVIRGMESATEFSPLVIESTSQGPGGWFYQTCMEAHDLKKRGIKPDRKGFHFVFVPWWKKKLNVMARTSRPESLRVHAQYFEQIERDNNVKLSQEQRNWWVSTLHGSARSDLQIMRQEFPGTVEEAFTLNDDALILHDQVEIMLKENRYTELSFGDKPCVCVWDFGWNDHTAFALFHDADGGNTNCVYAYQEREHDISHFFNIIKRLPVTIACHVLPHDAKIANSLTAQKLTKTSMSMEAYFLKAEEYHNLHTLDKLHDKSRGFFASRHFMPYLRICSRRAQPMFESLSRVRRHFNRAFNAYEDKLERHNPNNHLYDCLEGAAIIHANSPHLFRPRRVSKDLHALADMSTDEINPDGFAMP